MAFALPSHLTDTRGGCVALETALIQRSMYDVPWTRRQAAWPSPLADRRQMSASRGLVGAQIADIEHPWLPRILGCTALYWRIRVAG